jgi:hypothetical protein
MMTPDPKMYWSAVPRGQMPPPTVEDPVAQIWPVEKIRHCVWFTVKTLTALAKSRNPGRPGFGFVTAAWDAGAQSVRATRTRAPRRKAPTRFCCMGSPPIGVDCRDVSEGLPVKRIRGHD